MEGKGEFEEYRVVSSGWNRGGRAWREKRSRRQHSNRDAAATGALASRGREGRKEEDGG